MSRNLETFMKPERLLLTLLGALLALVCLKFPIWGVITLERKLDTYPLVSRDTIAIIDEMEETLEDFSVACEAHQAGERDALNGVDSYYDGFEFKDPEDLIDSATADMYAAVARRKTIAARANWNLFKSVALGTQAYTHSKWLCAPLYATFTTQINMGFTPTYNPA